MKITRITIGRLHNLGNYEHIRYELTAEIPDGESPGTALIGMERILEALDPKCPFPSMEEIGREQFRLDEKRKLDDEEFERLYRGTREEYTARMQEGIDENRAKRKAWDARHAKARKLLEDLGGAANWKDAKLDWEDGDYL